MYSVLSSYQLNHFLIQDAPIFVYIHGGCWIALNKNISAYCALGLIPSGYKVIVVGYDLCPSVTIEKIVEQIRKAAVCILNYAGKIGSKFVNFSGHSAGAHLTMFLTTNDFLAETQFSKLIKSVYLFSGIFDLVELKDTERMNANNMLSLNDENVKDLSPIYFNYKVLSESNITVKVFVAENDSKTFIKQSKGLAEVLKKFNAKVSYDLIENCDHFDIVENLSDSNFVVTKKIIEDL